MEKLMEALKKYVKEKFHGSVTIHFANGVPKKLEVKAVEDI